MLPDSPEKPVNHRSSVGEPSSPKFTSRVVNLSRSSFWIYLLVRYYKKSQRNLRLIDEKFKNPVRVD
uniref:Uncharacterized protein n=1 Tax=Helianthus annuus TaxID=4232 RepID=A0A251ULR7_HELAN